MLVEVLLVQWDRHCCNNCIDIIFAEAVSTRNLDFGFIKCEVFEYHVFTLPRSAEIALTRFLRSQDSTAVLGTKHGNAWEGVALTRDHKPDLKDEKQRASVEGLGWQCGEVPWY